MTAAVRLLFRRDIVGAAGRIPQSIRARCFTAKRPGGWAVVGAPAQPVRTTHGESAHTTRTIRTFGVVRQEGNFGSVLGEGRANLLVRSLVQLRANHGRVEVRCEERAEIARRRAVLDHGEELELCLHATRGEDGQCLSGFLPRF